MALTVAAALAGSAAVLALTPWNLLVIAGAALIAGGLVVGVPTGLWYHVKLYRALAPRGELPRGWWLRPNAFHGALRPGERRGVMVWFVLGAVGFLLIMLGCALMLAGALRSG